MLTARFPNTSNCSENNDLYDCVFGVLNDEFVAGLLGLVQRICIHILFTTHAWSTVAVLSVGLIFEN